MTSTLRHRQIKNCIMGVIKDKLKRKGVFMKSLKVKLLMLVPIFMLTFFMLIAGVWATVESKKINLKGSVDFTVSGNSLYIKDIRIREVDATTAGETINNFIPGFVSGDIILNLGRIDIEGSFDLLIDVVNTTTTFYQASTASTIENAEVSARGIINGDGISMTEVLTAQPSGTIELSVRTALAEQIVLQQVIIELEEYIPPGYIYVSNTQINDATPDTTADYNGGKSTSNEIDLSDIIFETGETEVILSLTSLNENYIKSIVSYDSGAVDYNTTGTNGTLFVHSTSLYLPKNEKEELIYGEKRELKIYVNNNTGAPITVSGLKVTFEEKSTLLQNDAENNYYYVEMGTIMGQQQSEYVRWRYFSDGQTPYQYSTSSPTGTGYFILETNVLSAIGRDGADNMINITYNNEYSTIEPFTHTENGWNNIYTYDYSTSSARQYISGEGAKSSYRYEANKCIPNGRYSNLLKDLNIDKESDLVYNIIEERSLDELYSDIGVQFPDFSQATIKYSKNDGDKLWLLSRSEIQGLLGDDLQDIVWARQYWLRTPFTVNIRTIYCVTQSGIQNINLNENQSATRAAFKLSIA